MATSRIKALQATGSDGFYGYLNTPDCGQKKSKNPQQHTVLARKILEDLDADGTDIKILSQDEGYIVWTDWVDPKMEELSPRSPTFLSGNIQMVSNLCYYAPCKTRPGSRATK